AGGLWVSVLLSGMSEEAVAEAFRTSAAYQPSNAGTRDYPLGLYAVALGDSPDAAGLASWQCAIQGGLHPAQVADAFLRSAPADAREVGQAYKVYLGRAGDAIGCRRG